MKGIYAVLHVVALLTAIDAIPVAGLFSRNLASDHFKYYELFDASPLRKRDLDMHIQIPYRGRRIPITLRRDGNIFSGNFSHPLVNKETHMAGKVPGYPESRVHLRMKKDNTFEGSVYLNPKLGTLHIESSGKYNMDKYGKMLVYHTHDLKKIKVDHPFTKSNVYLKKRSEQDPMLDRLKLILTDFMNKGNGQTQERDEAAQTSTSSAAAPATKTWEVAKAFWDTSSYYADQGSSAGGGEAMYYASDSFEALQPTTRTCRVAAIADSSYAAVHGAETGNRMAYFLNAAFSKLSQQIGTGLELAFMQACEEGDTSEICNPPEDPNTVVQFINAKLQESQTVRGSELCLVTVFSAKEMRGGAVGVSYVGTACQLGGQGLIVQDRGGTMSDAEFTATLMHEVAHSFGSPHDEPNSECSQRLFVMQPVIQVSDDMFTLSSCSLNSISEYLQKSEATCMVPASRARNGWRPRKIKEGTPFVACNHQKN